MRERVRSFTSEDYPGIVAVANAVNPAHPTAVDDMSYWDSTREERIIWDRLVYEEGEILGTGSYSLIAWMFHPKKYAGMVLVRPGARGRGIGSAIYDRILEQMEARGALSLRGEVREDRTESIRFAEKRGFVAGLKEQESALDLERFDPASFTDSLKRMKSEGIRIVGFEDLADDPDRYRKLYEAEGVSEKDMPAPEPLTQPSFENYCVKVFENPKFRADTFTVALAGDAYVGLSNLWTRNVPGSLDTGYTGVLREYRGRGIATALKVAVLGRAKELGFTEVLTWNDSTNAGMLGINWRLGFQKRPCWVDYENKLRAEDDAGAEEMKESEGSA